MRSAPKSGFTLIEALVSVVLVGIGISSAVATLGAISKSQFRAKEAEEMQKLAIYKYDDFLVNGGLSSGAASGDFQSLGETRFVWRARRSSTNVENLDSQVVEVAPVGEDFRIEQRVQGLVSKPPTTSSGASQ